jgi:hypothetical protein
MAPKISSAAMLAIRVLFLAFLAAAMTQAWAARFELSLPGGSVYNDSNFGNGRQMEINFTITGSDIGENALMILLHVFTLRRHDQWFFEIRLLANHRQSPSAYEWFSARTGNEGLLYLSFLRIFAILSQN